MILELYAATLGQESPFHGTKLSMTVDDRYHLQLQEYADGRVLIRTRLRKLPEHGPARDEVLQLCGRVLSGRMLRALVTCAIDARERAVWLQQTCVPGSTQVLDECVGAFVNELAFWVSVVKEE